MTQNIRKIMAIACGCLLAAATSMAQGILVEWTDGQAKSLVIAYEKNPQVSFPGNNTIRIGQDGSQDYIELDVETALPKISFVDNTDGIGTQTAARSLTVRTLADRIIVQGVKDRRSFLAANIGGQTLPFVTAGRDEVVIPLSSLFKGIVIIKADNQNIKIIRK